MYKLVKGIATANVTKTAEVDNRKPTDDEVEGETLILMEHLNEPYTQTLLAEGGVLRVPNESDDIGGMHAFGFLKNKTTFKRQVEQFNTPEMTGLMELWRRRCCVIRC